MGLCTEKVPIVFLGKACHFCWFSMCQRLDAISWGEHHATDSICVALHHFFVASLLLSASSYRIFLRSIC